MDFQLTDDQRAIADMAGSLFGDLCTDDRLRAFDTAGEPFMADLWKQCVETGLHALAIPEEAGGTGLGMTELVLLMITLALGAAARAHGIALKARREGDGWVLDGKVAAVALGAEVCRALLLAETDDGPRLVSVNLRDAGIEKVPGVFTHREAVADLGFHAHRLAADAVLPEAALPWLEQRAIAAIAALQLGVSVEQVRRTVEYINERRQFDRAIATFQAVQMSMADAHIAIEALRSALWQLVYRLDAGLPSPSEALAVKYLASECGHLVGHKAQHVHGGIGVDLTYPIHRYLYWSRALGITLGGSAATLERLGDWLANNDKLGWKYDLEEQQAL